MPAKHAYDLHYHNGHFYDPNTRHRVVLRDGIELQLTALPEAFMPFEPAGDAYDPRQLRTEADIRHELDHDPKVGSYSLLLPAGAELHFALHPPKPPVPEAKVAEYTFEVRLDEPLFVYRRPVAPPSLSGKPKPAPKTSADPGSLVDCRCQVYRAYRSGQGHDDAPNRLLYFEKVYARSLNSLIKNTYVHYFQNAGAPGRSAFDVMYFETHSPDLFPGTTRQTLGELREKIVPVIPSPEQ